MEGLRKIEEMALDSGVDPAAASLETIYKLVPGYPFRQRPDEPFQDVSRREDAPPGLGLITDLLAFDVSLVADRYDIPVEMQPLVAQYIQFFQGPGRQWFRTWMSRSSRYIPLMQPILEAAGVPRDTVYLAMIESGFSPQAYSRARAAGPWQFIPGTGHMFGLKQDFWIDERRDPIKSTQAAAQYLKQLREELGHWYLAWAGYNAGGGRIRRLCEKKGSEDFWEIAEGRGMAKETRHYVPKLIAAALIAKNPSAFGFADGEFAYQRPLEYDEVPVVDPTELAVLAPAVGISEEALRELNPELKRWCTPPATEDRPYLLRIPKGGAEAFTAALAKIPKKARMRYEEYRVRSGDTLSGIAQRFGTSAEVILTFNRLKSARKLRVNTELMIPVALGRVADASRPAPSPTVAGRRGGVRHGALASSDAGRTHQIASGDTLWSLSQRYGVSVQQLKRWNDISDHRSVRVGQKLRVEAPGKL
jgi:membrane-bound lytic murein transglycosylase D